MYLSKARYRQFFVAFEEEASCEEAHSFWNKSAFLIILMHENTASESALIFKLPTEPI
jgi:hypothetical protein